MWKVLIVKRNPKIKCPKCNSYNIDIYDKANIFAVSSYCNECETGFTTYYRLVFKNQEIFDDGKSDDEKM